MTALLVGILTVSDRCSKGTQPDLSGNVLETVITSNVGDLKCTIVRRECVPDDLSTISQTLKNWSDELHLDLIITTGGTGFAKRDVTPEATKGILEREAPGIAVAILMESLKSTPMAMLSRLVCGIRKRTLIVNFPGSPKACSQCWHIIKPILMHSTDLLRDSDRANEYHNEVINANIQSSEVTSKVKINQVARRQRSSPYPMIEVKDAQAKVLQSVRLMEQIQMNTNDALGYVLCKDVSAEEHFPPFRASVKDGYAVIADDGAGSRTVISSSLAGSSFNPALEPYLHSGECMRITTGARVPNGADAVVQVEDTLLISEDGAGETELSVNILKAPVHEQDIRKVGSDITKGDLILGGGTMLTSSEMGVLATAGVCKVTVVNKPKIAVLSTGNELQQFDEDSQPGKIRDSNKITILALLKENGFSAVDCGITLDDPDILLNKIRNALADVDVLITTGGVSMGERDLVADVLVKDLEAVMHFGRINMKPGKPTKFFEIPAEEGKKFVFALPGNPVSAAVTCHLFVLPALKAMSGVRKPLPMLFNVKTACDLKLDERSEFARAQLEWSDFDNLPSAVLTGNQISCRMMNMVAADCLLHLPAATESIKRLIKGSVVKAQFMPH